MIKYYVDLANICFMCKDEGEAYAALFDGFIICCIVIAGVMVGLQTYPSYEDENVNKIDHPWVPIVNNFVLVAFVFESIVKICAEGMAPWRYGARWQLAWASWVPHFVYVS